MIKKVSTQNAPAAIGPYSQATVANNFVFTSGQIPLDNRTGAIAGDTIEEQAVQALKNVTEVLKASGTDGDHVVKTTCFLADMKDFAAFNEIYAQFFPGCPARSCVAVRSLPKNVLVEVEVVAQLP